MSAFHPFEKLGQSACRQTVQASLDVYLLRDLQRVSHFDAEIPSHLPRSTPPSQDTLHTAPRTSAAGTRTDGDERKLNRAQAMCLYGAIETAELKTISAPLKTSRSEIQARLPAGIAGLTGCHGHVQGRSASRACHLCPEMVAKATVI